MDSGILGQMCVWGGEAARRGWGWGDFWHSCKWLNGFVAWCFYPSQLSFRANPKDLSERLKNFLSGCGIFQRGSGRMGIFSLLFLPNILYSYKPTCKMQNEPRHPVVAFVFISLAFWLNVSGGVVHFNTDVCLFFFFPLVNKPKKSDRIQLAYKARRLFL